MTLEEAKRRHVEANHEANGKRLGHDWSNFYECGTLRCMRFRKEAGIDLLVCPTCRQGLHSAGTWVHSPTAALV